MSTHADTTTDDAQKTPKRVKPHQLALVLGIAMGIFILVSGILPQITGWKNENPVHRTVFVNIPGPIQIALSFFQPVICGRMPDTTMKMPIAIPSTRAS